MKNNNGYYTHQPILIEVLKKLREIDKPSIIELGCGHGSTNLIHDFVNEHGWALTYDHDAVWLKEFQHLSEPNHEFHHTNVENWHDIYQKIIDRPIGFEIGLIIIDNAPWEARSLAIEMLKNYAEYIVKKIIYFQKYF